MTMLHVASDALRMMLNLPRLSRQGKPYVRREAMPVLTHAMLCVEAIERSPARPATTRRCALLLVAAAAGMSLDKTARAAAGHGSVEARYRASKGIRDVALAFGWSRRGLRAIITSSWPETCDGRPS